MLSFPRFSTRQSRLQMLGSGSTRGPLVGSWLDSAYFLARGLLPLMIQILHDPIHAMPLSFQEFLYFGMYSRAGCLLSTGPS